MTHQEILEKAIQKAIDNGWNGESSSYEYTTPSTEPGGLGQPSLEEIIFNHSFAKALWGDKQVEIAQSTKHLKLKGKFTRSVPGHEGWQYHLQNMVIADDPIKYLGANL